jgi:hypothetical protein
MAVVGSALLAAGGLVVTVIVIRAIAGAVNAG